jgi:hypothetical protein
MKVMGVTEIKFAVSSDATEGRPSILIVVG